MRGDLDIRIYTLENTNSYKAKKRYFIMEESIAQKLKKRSFRLEEVIRRSDLSRGLALLAVDIAKGNYTAIKIVPIEIALEGEGLTPAPDFEGAHLVYSRRSEKYAEEMRGKVKHVLIDCFDRNGERVHLSY